MTTSDISDTNKKKGDALVRRLRELRAEGHRLTEPEIAHALDKSRASIANWKAGLNWPSVTEEQKLAVVIGLHPAFFARIGAGWSYEEAKNIKRGETVMSDEDFTMLLTDALLHLTPLDPNIQYRVDEVRSHLNRQVKLLFSLVYPDVEPTPANIERLFALMRKTPLR